MKKILLIILMFSAYTLQAQNYTNFLKSFLGSRTPSEIELETLKTEIDKMAVDPKSQNKPETLVWKTRIYYTISKNPKLNAKYPDAGSIAAATVTKYIAADPSLKVMAEQTQADVIKSVVFDIYQDSRPKGIAGFKDKNWDTVAYYFEREATFGDLIFKNKWSNDTTIAFDTLGHLYAGVGYQNAKKFEEAAKHYSLLADANVGGDDYMDMYKFLLVHLSQEKKEAQFNKYLATAKKLYPKANWKEYEVDYMNRNYSLQDKVNLFDKEDAAGSLDALKYMHFADAFVNAKDDKAIDSSKLPALKAKASYAFKKAYNKYNEAGGSGTDNQSGLAAYNVGVMYYTDFNDIDDLQREQYKKLSSLNQNRVVEKDPKKKAEADAKFKVETDAVKKAAQAFEKPIIENMDSSIVWLEKAYLALKDKPSRSTTEKNCVNRAVDMLANLYDYKKNKSRGKDPKAYDLYEAKFKEYDALHGKF
jgi:hypothetical protein